MYNNMYLCLIAAYTIQLGNSLDDINRFKIVTFK